MAHLNPELYRSDIGNVNVWPSPMALVKFSNPGLLIKRVKYASCIQYIRNTNKINRRGTEI